MTTVGNIGIGLFILIIIWILALFIFVLAVRTQSNLGWLAVGTAFCITLILILIPTEKVNEAKQDTDETVSKLKIDYSPITYFSCRKRTTHSSTALCCFRSCY